MTDTGIGIAAEDLETCLSPFGQAGSVLTRTSEGAGLGLALAKRYAEALGGTLTIVSEVGRGTRASLILPRAEGAPSPRRVATAAMGCPETFSS